jgi:SAM-dependent methyltransferase
MPDTPAVERRRAFLVENADLSKLVGLEIGPYDRPIVKREMGRVLYSDMRTAEILRQITNPATGRVIEDIVEVDVVVSPGEEMQLPHKVDYIVASHVIEHMPDPAGWLNGLKKHLNPNGFIFLAVPDREFTFDHIRPETTLGSLIEKAMTAPTQPTPAEVFDAFYYHLSNIGQRTRTYSTEFALKQAKKARDGEYVGCHCLVFTSESFKRDFTSLYELGLCDLKITASINAKLPYNDILCIFQ